MKTVEEIRHDRLLMLRDEYGSVAALAKQIEKSYAQVSQWVNRSKSTRNSQPRSMNSETVREIELKTNKPRGWMDQPITDELGEEVIQLSILGLNREDVKLDLIEFIRLFKLSEEEKREKAKDLLSGRNNARSKKPREGKQSNDDK